MDENLTKFDELKQYLGRRPRTVVLTGAGISAERGLPTFRDAKTGLWAAYRPEELATPEAFRRNPTLVWKWYAWRRELLNHTRPNSGHHALVELERRLPEFTLITQNVDGLHQAAGSCNVIELHGNIRRVRCFDENLGIENWEENTESPPRCPRCGGLLRPDVVWFGEPLPAQALAAAFQAARACDLFFSIGTSGLVEPAASLAYAALEQDAKVVEINPQPTPLSHLATWKLRGLAGEILPQIIPAE